MASDSISATVDERTIKAVEELIEKINKLKNKTVTINLKDKITEPLNRIIKKVDKLNNKRITTVCNINDRVSRPLNEIEQQINTIRSQRVNIDVNANTNSVGKLAKIKGQTDKVAGAFKSCAVKVAGFAKDSIIAAQAQAANELKLKSVLNLRTGASEQAANSILKMIAVQQSEGVVSDEVQMAGAQQLASYAKSSNSISTLLPAMNNLIAKQKGLGSTTKDGTQIAKLMGEGLNGQTDKLKKAGIVFTEAEENTLSFGNEEERAATLAKVISRNVGNANKQMAKTDAGAIKQAKDQFLELKESIGKMLLPYLTKFAKWFTENQPTIIKVISTIVETFMTIGEPIFNVLNGFFNIIKENEAVATVIGVFVAVFGALAAAIAIFNAVLAISPIFLIVGVIALIIAGIVALIKHCSKLGKVFSGIKSFFGGGGDSEPRGVGEPAKAGVGAKALGTSYWKGGLTYINERGGEIVDLPNGSRVIPADKSDRLLSGNGMSFGNVYITAKGVTAQQVVNEIVPQLKLQLANM